MKILPTFLKNSAYLMIANMAAQLIFIAFTPLLTRIYGPDAFGFAITFYSISVLFGIVVSGRLDLAVVMQSTDEDAYQVYASAITFAGITSIIILLLSMTVNHLNIDRINSHPVAEYLWLIPIVGFAYSTQILSLSLGNRLRAYGRMSVSIIIGSIIMVSYALSSGILLSRDDGLLFGRAFGTMAVSVLLVFLIRQHIARARTAKNINITKSLLGNKRYPLINVPYSASEFLSQELIAILAIAYYRSDLAGYYVLIRLALVLPFSLASTAMGQVFFRDAVDDRTLGRTESRALLLWRMTSSAAAPVLVAVAIFGNEIFSLIFGEDWTEAGTMASIYALPAFVIASTSFASRMYEINYRQDLALKLSLTYLSTKIIFMVFLFDRQYDNMAIMSANAAIDLIYFLSYIYFLAKISRFRAISMFKTIFSYGIVYGGLSALVSIFLLWAGGSNAASAILAVVAAALLGCAGVMSVIRQLLTLEPTLP